jgi:hypothetical protein
MQPRSGIGSQANSGLKIFVFVSQINSIRQLPGSGGSLSQDKQVANQEEKYREIGVDVQTRFARYSDWFS